MEKSTEPVLKQGVVHPNPVVRYGTALAIGKRNLPMLDELLTLMDDDDLYVQQAARQSLIVMSKKKTGNFVDFGPLPGCKCEQVQESILMWRDWWEKNKKNK